MALQKATELGVTQITPIITERTEVRLKADRLEKKVKHWQKILIAACEQSGRAVIPILNSVISFEEAVGAKFDEEEFLKCILHPASKAKISELSAMKKPERVDLLIGPEGGFSENELQLASQHKFQFFTCGQRVAAYGNRTYSCIIVIAAMVGGLLRILTLGF